VSDVEQRAAELVAALAAAGLNATQDIGKVKALMTPKGAVGAGVVLVVPMPTFVDSTLCGDWQRTWQIVAMAPRTNGLPPAKRLVEMVEVVADTLTISDARPTSYAFEQGQPGFPAYTMTLED
jgi:hypothetical protein